MRSTEQLERLLEQARQGDRDAAATLWFELRPQVERLIRVNLRDSVIRGTTDTAVLYSTLAKRIVVERNLLAEKDVKSFNELFRLIRRVLRNRILNLERGFLRLRIREAAYAIENAPESPSAVRAKAELIAEVQEAARNEMTPDEWSLFDAVKIDGRSYVELAKERGTTADALRQKLNRAIDRVRSRLGPEQP